MGAPAIRRIRAWLTSDVAVTPTGNHLLLAEARWHGHICAVLELRVTQSRLGEWFTSITSPANVCLVFGQSGAGKYTVGMRNIARG